MPLEFDEIWLLKSHGSHVDAIGFDADLIAKNFMDLHEIPLGFGEVLFATNLMDSP